MAIDMKTSVLLLAAAGWSCPGSAATLERSDDVACPFGCSPAPAEAPKNRDHLCWRAAR
ncbi:hypothetical protein [Mangrovicoccus ximenensis]|uniref:hypothetical protein n=1 Tax=Mangrovicoccus ximenensis TaxID=1911570 RepID=UPI0013750D16|nr:hypothetical protein [Mangrovicoccus ximenensis]